MPDAHVKYGNSLHALGRGEEAAAQYRKALTLRADDIEAECNLGTTLQALGRHDEAVSAYRRALAIDPESGQVHFNLGNALQMLDRNEEALQSYERAVALMPDPALARQNRGLLNLTLGRFSEGWDILETRFETKLVVPRDYSQPRWTGGRVDGTFLVWGEQGLGDQIIYASMLPDLRAYATAIVLEVEPRLVPLFARSFSEIEVVPLGPELYAGAIAAHESLVSLGRRLRLSWESFGTPERGYLSADAGQTAGLRRRLSHDGKRVIGLSWQSFNPEYGKDKSARLIDFVAALRLPNCRFVDLQYGDTRAERASLAAELGIEVERIDDIDNTNDIDGLAALASACDAVLTVSNTTAHLCGALGRPTFVLVPYDKFRIWYWFKERPRSPWYPRVRVVRQKIGQPWSDMVSAVVPELSEWLAQA
jgi:tetratricopeptide (TPR) repeat protein